MIHEIRTYDLKPRSTEEFGRRTAACLPYRLELSSLGGFWYTEVGPLNQVVHLWPYEDLNQRADVRQRAVAGGGWPPDNGEFVVEMRTEIFLPAPFMAPLAERDLGPVYEMRTYTYRSGEVPRVLDAWADGIAEREKLSPLAGCWYSEIGDLNRFVHLWAYRSFDERARVRREARERGIWPPPSGVAPVKQENKLMLPFDFSPMQ